MSVESGVFHSENIRRRDDGLRIWSGARYGGPITWELSNGKLSYRLPPVMTTKSHVAHSHGEQMTDSSPYERTAESTQQVSPSTTQVPQNLTERLQNNE